MKISIDTKEDTHEDIRKVINMLSHLVGDNPATNQPNLFDDSDSFGQESSPQENNSGGIFGNMFNNPQSSESSEQKTEVKEEKPEIIPY